MHDYYERRNQEAPFNAVIILCCAVAGIIILIYAALTH